MSDVSLPFTLYTTGYSGPRVDKGVNKVSALRDVVERLDADLWDIRFNPTSPSPIWRRYALERTFLGRYKWLQALGNRNYKGRADPHGGSAFEVELVDPVRGAEEVLSRLWGRSVVLLCGCEDREFCHRSDAAEAVRTAAEAKGLTVRVFELVRWDADALIRGEGVELIEPDEIGTPEAWG